MGELESLRGKKGKSSSPEDNLLDMAIQDELKEQVTKAEKEAKELKKQVKDLKEMENSFALLKARSEELENVLTSTRQEREELSGKVIELQLQIDALIEEQDILKNVDICNKQLQEECESLKLRLDSSQSEKALSSGKEVSLDAIAAETVIPDPCDNKEKSRMQEEYAYFQETNQHLQAEIESLKNCIEEQSTSNEELQKQLEIFHQFGAQKFSTDSMNVEQLQAAVNFERGLVANLHRDIARKDDRIKMLEQQLDVLHCGVKPHTDQGLQGLPPLSPLEIFDRHSVHPPLSPPQISPDQLHQQQIFAPAKPSVLSIILPRQSSIEKGITLHQLIVSLRFAEFLKQILWISLLKMIVCNTNWM